MAGKKLIIIELSNLVILDFDNDYKYILPFYIDAKFKSQSITEKICAHCS